MRAKSLCSVVNVTLSGIKKGSLSPNLGIVLP